MGITMKSCSFFICLLLGMSVLFTTNVFPQKYDVIHLGSLGGIRPTPYGINDKGEVVGYSYGPGNNLFRAFLWKNGGMSDLGFGNNNSMAYRINEEGQAVGYNQTYDFAVRHAYLWENGVRTDLDASGGKNSIAAAINDLGQVVGSFFDTTSREVHTFIWQNGSMTDLGKLGGVTFSGALGINNQGQIIGNYDPVDSTSYVHAYLYNNGGVTDMGSFVYPEEINNQGQVVGYFLPEGSHLLHAFLWENGSKTDLGTLGGERSRAFGINDSGQVVGWTNYQSGRQVAFLWEKGVTTDLNSLIDSTAPWILREANAINNKGQIVGVGEHNYVEFAFLLTPKPLTVTKPQGGDLWIAGETDTIRWINAPEGSNIVLELSLDSGRTWKFLAGPIPADSEKYHWTVPDTFSAKARILISDANDFTVNDTSDVFKLRNYTLRKLSATGDYIPYKPSDDFWRFRNSAADIWRPSWYARFNYDGIDPFTNKSYKSGELVTSRIFALAQSSDFPDWPSFVRAFGTTACYLNMQTPVYSPRAVVLWESKKMNYRGSCFGIALSNALAFKHPSNFHNKYRNFPDFSVPFLVDPDSLSLPVIHELFTHQYGQQHTSYLDNVVSVKTPTQTLNELKAMLLDESEPIRILRMVNNGGNSGAHAVLAYKLVPDDVLDNTYHVYIYENNNPNSQTEEIIISTFTNNGNGSWHAPSAPGWGGNRGLYLRDDAFTYFNFPTLPIASPESQTSPFTLPPNKMEIDVAGEANVTIKNAIGNITGYIDSLVHEEIPGSAALIIDNSSKTPPYGYSLPSSSYSVMVSHFNAPDNRLYFFSGDTSFRIQRTGATSNQTDRMFFDGTLSIVNPDTVGKNFDVVNITRKYMVWQDQYQWVERVFSIRSLALSESDSVRIENIGDGGLKLGVFGTNSKTYNLDLELAAYTGAKSFTHGSIQLEGNSSHIIQPNWVSLGDSALKILIDYGNDGTIDDSMLVDNQVTGVYDSQDRGIPAEFALYQNYPNPFNPRTTISYELPRRVHVSIKVYDVFGREVATLVDGVQNAGVRSVEWDAASFASGIYFCKLQAGGYVATRKLILTK